MNHWINKVMGVENHQSEEHPGRGHSRIGFPTPMHSPLQSLPPIR